MGIFDWLFGTKPKPPQWYLSENENPTIVIGDYRATVFEQDGGWKYVFADLDDEEEPYFSEVFGTQEEAMEAALDMFG